MDKSLNVLRDILELEMELSGAKKIDNDAMVHYEGYVIFSVESKKFLSSKKEC